MRQEIKESLAKSDLDVQIDSVALEQYLESSLLCNQITRAAIKVGFTNMGGIIEQLVPICQKLEVSTLKELNDLLTAFVAKADLFFEEFARRRRHDQVIDFKISGDPDHWCAIAVVAMCIGRAGMTSLKKSQIWSDGYLADVVKTAKSIFSHDGMTLESEQVG